MARAPKIQVRMLAGELAGQSVAGNVYTLLQPYQTNSRGGYIVVCGRHQGRGALRVRVNSERDFQVIQGSAVPENVIQFQAAQQQEAQQPELTDDELMARIEERFSILDRMAQAAIEGDIRSLIVQGPPGVGKSHGVLTQMEQASMFDQLAGRPPRFEIVKGALTSLGLYAMLYKFSDPGCVLVFDDCDSIFNDELSLNICKAALDSSKRRRIFWNADSNLLRREGIPDSFDFRGSVIFITNVDFNNIRSRKIQDHLAALSSRSHFVDLGIDSQRGKLLRIRQIVNKGMLDDYCFGDQGNQEIVDFIVENQNRWREISLRLVIKLADLRKIMPQDWQRTATVTLMQ